LTVYPKGAASLRDGTVRAASLRDGTVRAASLRDGIADR